MHCGLDFGTSNTTLGTAATGAPRLLPLEGDRTTIPSVIYFPFDGGRASFGRAALAEYVNGGDGRLMRSLKSLLGTSTMAERTRVKDRVLAFTDILGLFVRRLKERAEETLGVGIDDVVVGRPARFDDDDDAADRLAQDQLEEAVRRQGFRHVSFQFEPIAAAFEVEQRMDGEALALVADLGGGTSDFTVIRLSPERAGSTDRSADILATNGVHIGGTDFDRALALDKVTPLLGRGTETADGKRILPMLPYVDLSTWHRINRLYDPKMRRDLDETRKEAARPELVEKLISIVDHREGHRLLAAVEETKIALSDYDEADFAFTGAEVALETPVGRDEFDDDIAGMVTRISGTIEDALGAAGVGGDAIDMLILTGGSTEVPLVADSLRRQFPDARLVRTDAFGSVGTGLAIEARRRYG